MASYCKVVSSNPSLSAHARASSGASYASFSTSLAKGGLSSIQQALYDLDLPESLSVFTAGSASKFEIPFPELEPISLVFVCDGSTRKATQKKIHHLASSHFPAASLHVEWKDPNSDPLSRSHRVQTAFPSHFLHRQRLFGCSKNQDRLLFQFVREIQEMPGKERQKFRKSFVKNHLKQLAATIEGKDIRGVDLKKGMMFYDSKKRQATKYSLLLPIQYVLDLRIIDAIRVLSHWPKDYVSFLKFMPNKISELIDYMFAERLLPELDKQDIQDLKQAYEFGLFYNQIGQEFYAISKGKKTAFPITDDRRLQQAYANAQRILSKIDSSQYCRSNRSPKLY